MPVDVDRICVIVGRTRHKMVAIELQEATKLGATLIELRLDFLAKAIDFQRLLPLKKCAWLATLRRPDDGGRFKGSETERLMILRQAIVAGFDWVDLETDVIDKVPRFGKIKRIVSYHNFTETPSNIEEIHAQMCKQDADVIKISVMALEPSDNLRILNLIKNSPKPTIGHCMGEMGIPSRLLALKYGSPFIFAAFNKERGIAPGLLSLDEIRRFYSIASITSDTKVYGVIGEPVSHSLSPVLHNQLFKHYQLNCLYLPFRVPVGELKPMLKSFDSIPVDGYSITIPHKEAAAEVASSLDERAKETKSANTLIRTPQGFAAYNTDYPAVLESIKDYLPSSEDGNPREWDHCIALVLGAGGVARAVVHALRELGVSVTISSRTHSRAENLANEIHCKAIDWPLRYRVNCDILVNCTPVGMHPDVDETPIHPSHLRAGMLVLDTIYTPETTLLVKEARLRGCQVVTGVEMFIRQAAKQFQLFTGIQPDLDKLRELMRRALSPVTSAMDAITNSDNASEAESLDSK